MKKISYLVALAIVAVSLSLTSCTEDQLTSSPISVDTTRTATITGVVYAELNLQNDDLEFAPVGTKLLVTIPFSQLNTNVEDGNWEKMVTVEANGMYTIEVPSNNEGVTATITPNEFMADLILKIGSPSPSEKTVYTSAPTNVSVKVGLTAYQDLFYTQKLYY